MTADINLFSLSCQQNIYIIFLMNVNVVKGTELGGTLDLFNFSKFLQLITTQSSMLCLKQKYSDLPATCFEEVYTRQVLF